MVDVASLGIRVDTNQLKQGTAELDRFKRKAGQVEVQVGKMVAGMATFAKSVATGFFAGASVRSAQLLLDSSVRITNALKTAGLEDTALTRVYDRLFQSAQRNAAPLEALVTLYGRASLVQKELRASQSDLLNFTDKVALALRVSGQSAEEASGALLQLSQILGAGTVRAEEFNSVQEGALPILQAVAAGLKEAGGSVAKLRSLVIDGKVSSEAFFRAFEAGAAILEDKVAGSEMTVSQGFVRLQNVLIDAAGKIDTVTGASKTAGRALDAIAGVVEGVGNAIRRFADSDLSYLAEKLYAILNPIDQLTDKLGGMKNLPTIISTINEAMFKAAAGQPIGTPPKQPDIRQIARDALGLAGKEGRVGKVSTPGMTDEQISDRINSAFGTASNVKPVSLADYPVSSKQKKPKAHTKTTSQMIDTDIQAVKDRTAALQAEIQMVGLSYQEQEKRRMSLDLEQSALAKLRDEAIKKGKTDLSNIKLSEDQRAKIEAVSDAYAEQAEKLRLVQETQEKAEQASADFYDSFKGSITDLITGADSLADALTNIGNRLADLALNSAFDALFKPSSQGRGGGILGGLFSSVGGLFTSVGAGTGYFPPAPSGGLGLFADGGISNKPAIFGEAGPEAAVPLPDGRHIPVKMMGGGEGRSQNVNVTTDVKISFDKDGNPLAAVDSRIDQKIVANNKMRDKSAAVTTANAVRAGNPRGYYTR